jgi:DNA-binding response OmpR family regulator
MVERKLMIIDDDPDTLIILKTVFEYVGFTVIIADNKSKCLGELEKGFRGVIIIDINVPYLNGWNTLKGIVSNGYVYGNRLIILSSEKNPDSRIEQFNEYIDDYIIKPFDVEYLLSSVKKSLLSIDNVNEVTA